MGPPNELAVAAVGGNALIRDKDHESIPDQSREAALTTHHIAEMIATGWNVVITHGTGPQVGFILRRSELALEEVLPCRWTMPMRICRAASDTCSSKPALQRISQAEDRPEGGGHHHADLGGPNRSGIYRSLQADRIAHGRRDGTTTCSSPRMDPPGTIPGAGGGGLCRRRSRRPSSS